MLKKLLAVLLIATMLASAFAALAEETDIHLPTVILYTNDVHCSLEDNIGYAGVAAYKKAYENMGYAVALVDNGDAIQGGSIGTLSKGAYIIDIMNEIGYDVATIGNHEFDYGIDQFMTLRDQANFPYVAANFCDTEGEAVLDAYVLYELGGYNIAFVGVATPETYAKSKPDNFIDDEGNYIYNFSQGENGALLYAAVQEAVDAAIAEGAEIVVAMSHLGTDAPSSPYTSGELIANTTGIDVVLDGHSHSVWEQEILLNKDGEEVILSSSGSHLENIGALIISCEDSEDGHEVSLSTKLHSENLFKDEEVAAFIDDVEALYADSLNEVVALSEFDLFITDPVTGERTVCSRDTNMGNLFADAYRSILGADIAFQHGGGLRANIEAGDITYNEVLKVVPYGNSACMIEISGQDILDALEMGARALPDQSGAFLQTSGLTYEINTAIESTVILDTEGNFVEVAGDRRVENVLVDGKPIDPAATYTVSGCDFILLSGGDGLTMFKNGTVIVSEVAIDNQVLINYMTNELGGVVGEDYADPYGQGRIVVR